MRENTLRGCSKNAAVYKPGRALTRNSTVLGLSSLRNCEKINFWCLSPSVCGILLWSKTVNKTQDSCVLDEQ